MPGQLSASAFYGEWAGHTTSDLSLLLANLPAKVPKVWLLGDSSLDNKAWPPASSWRPACNGYEVILEPPRSRPDIAYFLNKEFETRGIEYVCINGAVEESTLGSRASSLKPQDEFVRDHLAPDDILICSVGGNDIALRPSLSTVTSMTSLVAFASDAAIDAGNATGLAHFVDMFGRATEDWISRICAKTKPKLVIVNMIYYPHEKAGGSWADMSLSLLRYNTNPGRLQHLIRKVYELGTCTVNIEGTKVVPNALFDILDPRLDSTDYIARVEPSESGGAKMAAKFADIIEREAGLKGNGADA